MRPTETDGLPTDETADPVIDEIRAIRWRISEELGHDPDRVVEYYRQWRLPLRGDEKDDPSGKPEANNGSGAGGDSSAPAATEPSSAP